MGDLKLEYSKPKNKQKKIALVHTLKITTQVA